MHSSEQVQVRDRALVAHIMADRSHIHSHNLHRCEVVRKLRHVQQAVCGPEHVQGMFGVVIGRVSIDALDIEQECCQFAKIDSKVEQAPVAQKQQEAHY